VATPGKLTARQLDTSPPGSDHARVSGVVDEWRTRIAAVRLEVTEHARRVGRAPDDVTIVAVTKTLPPEAVVAAARAGLSDAGENYVQEARDKRPRSPEAVRWHLIGALQRNKAKLAAQVFDRVHSLDTLAVAEVLAQASHALGRRLPVLLQVNTAPGRDRHGVTADEAFGLAEGVLALPGLALDGLMTIAPADAAGEASRGHFRALREVRDRLATRLGVELPHLSMGMSEDFVVALEEGATMLRLGRVLFGARGPAAWREGS
jgi:pyridoxal phosphate enzyme (YggS family)